MSRDEEECKREDEGECERKLIFEMDGQENNWNVLAGYLKRVGITVEEAEGGREGQKRIIRWDDDEVEKCLSRDAGNV